MENKIKVGDIFAGTWGYSMIIPAFFIVTRVTAKRVKVRELEKHMAGMQGYERPFEPYRVDESEKERICTVTGDGCLRVPQGYSSHIWAYPWDGRSIWADYMD